MERVDAILESVVGNLTAANGPELLRPYACPLCGVAAGYETFRHSTTGAVGLRCRARDLPDDRPRHASPGRPLRELHPRC